MPSVIALHAGIWAAMRLDYWPMAATVLIAMTDWPALADRLRPARRAGALQAERSGARAGSRE